MIADVDDLAEEFARRLRAGEEPDESEYAARHPAQADEIRAALSAVRRLERLKPKREAVAPPAAPRRLGEFRLLREIGRGGMGVVYEAEQEGLGRRVAVKVLPAHLLADPRLRERFKREAQAAARLRHPHIVPVHGVGEQDGVCFYVMQLIDGQGLDRVIRDGAEEEAGARWRRVASVGAQAADALAYAHAQGVLHRDIKPGNLILDADGTVWVADFGVAKLAEEAGLTQSGDLVGTLRYMPPERFQGTSEARGDQPTLRRMSSTWRVPGRAGCRVSRKRFSSAERPFGPPRSRTTPWPGRRATLPGRGVPRPSRASATAAPVDSSSGLRMSRAAGLETGRTLDGSRPSRSRRSRRSGRVASLTTSGPSKQRSAAFLTAAARSALPASRNVSARSSGWMFSRNTARSARRPGFFSTAAASGSTAREVLEEARVARTRSKPRTASREGISTRKAAAEASCALSALSCAGTSRPCRMWSLGRASSTRSSWPRGSISPAARMGRRGVSGLAGGGTGWPSSGISGSFSSMTRTGGTSGTTGGFGSGVLCARPGPSFGAGRSMGEGSSFLARPPGLGAVADEWRRKEPTPTARRTAAAAA
ncbi:MAG: serine/threonine protein kinase [Gemmataceae bacterium]|nr:serine/threonine protein kinase [Gemmataceae bacterium]